MASEELKLDSNNKPVAGAVTDDSNEYIKMMRIDDATKGLKCMIVGGSGAGTVTSVSVVTANGVSGSVANSTTTPAITLTLGNITPSAVQISGLTASQIVGTDGSKNLVSLDVATYPSLTELSYVKGVTSAIQTQLNATKTVYKSSNETVNNSAVLQNDDALLFAVGANERWAVNLELLLSSGTTPDFKYTFSLPVGATMYFANDDSFQDATAQGSNLTVNTTGNVMIGVIRAVIYVGANAGTVNFQWAQNTATASDTIVYAGSYLVARKLA